MWSLLVDKERLSHKDFLVELVKEIVAAWKAWQFQWKKILQPERGAEHHAMEESCCDIPVVE